MAVEIITLQTESVLLKTTLPARTAAIRIAEVHPQVNGIIEQRLFTEDAMMRTGEQLYQIEPDRYQAEVTNARANLQLAETNLKVSTSLGQCYKALAAFEQAKAQIAVNKAALDMALINLCYNKVNTPSDGQIVISHVTEGALVSAAQTNSMATIHQLDPIYVDISQAAKDVLNLRRQRLSCLFKCH